MKRSVRGGVPGAEIFACLPNDYGSLLGRMSDGLPTDRPVCQWAVPSRLTPTTSSPACFKISISQNIDRLKEENPDHAQRWQRVVRHRFQDAFRLGYQVLGFSRTPLPAYLVGRV